MGYFYGNNWHHIDGFSEDVLDYIQEYEAAILEKQDCENSEAAEARG